MKGAVSRSFSFGIRVLGIAFLLAADPCTTLSAQQSKDEVSRPEFCGAAVPPKQSIKDASEAPPPLAPGKARLWIYWKLNKFNQVRFTGVQCFVFLGGTLVAALRPDSYLSVDVDPGKLRLCAASSFGFRGQLGPAWPSLMFVNAAAGESHFIDCKPGGDNFGVIYPTLSETEPKEGEEFISKSQHVAFQEVRKH